MAGDAPATFFAGRPGVEVRSKRHRYDLKGPIKPEPVPGDIRAERAAAYVELRRLLPEGAGDWLHPTGIGLAHRRLQPRWRLDAYLAAIAQVAAAYDEFLDFSIPSALTRSTERTYDGSHYTRAVNGRVLAGLMANQSDLAVDWRKEDLAAITALYHNGLAEFMGTITEAEASTKRSRSAEGNLGGR